MGQSVLVSIKMRVPLLSIFLVAVALFCLADEGEALRRKRHRRKSKSSKSSSSKSSGHRHIESKIHKLEKKFKKLTHKSCKDGAQGKDGDCNNICSEGFQLTFEGGESKTGRAACCKPDHVVTPTGSCRPNDDTEGGKFVPPVCYQLKGRLRSLTSTGVFTGSIMYLRGFQGEIEGNTYRCDNKGCCSSSNDFSTVEDDFAICGLDVTSTTLDAEGYGQSQSQLPDLECDIIKVNSINFDMGKTEAFYGGVLNE